LAGGLLNESSFGPPVAGEKKRKKRKIRAKDTLQRQKLVGGKRLGVLQKCG